MLTRTRIGELLDAHDLSPSRALGQNFLCDPSMVDKIVRTAGVGPDTPVVEIGPGLGSLTLGLCRAGASVTAIEVDRYLLSPLREVTAEYLADGRLKIINADAMDLDWSTVLETAQTGGDDEARLASHDRDQIGGDDGARLASRDREQIGGDDGARLASRDREQIGGDDGAWTVVANLPYNIATPLVLDLLAAQPALKNWVVMVQREAGERLVAEPGSRVYGIPSVLRAFWADASLAGAVPADVFLPRPKVESVLVKITRRREPETPGDYARFASVVRRAFGQRRKMLRRSLSAVAEPEVFERAAIDPTWRPEQLSVDDWCRLVENMERPHP